MLTSPMRIARTVTSSPKPAAPRTPFPNLEVTAEASRAPEMLARARTSRMGREARRWLAERIGDAIAGLIPLASGSSPLAEEARDCLRALKAEGFGPVLRNHFQELSPSIRAKLWREVIEHGEEPPPAFEEATTPRWLAKFRLRTRSRRPLGRGWLFPHRLPDILIGKHRLNEAQKDQLLRALRGNSPARPDPFLAALCRHADPRSTDAFAWALFDQWDSRDQPSRGAWALRALAVLGGEGCAIRLAHLIALWLKEGRWRCARLGLECLRQMELRTAQTQLFHFARTLRSPRWAKMVRGWLTEAAQEHHCSLAELGEMSVPALGLDPHGVRIFSYGRRRFRVVVGPCLRLSVEDERGRRLAALPEPNGRDDFPAALQSFEDWFYFRKQLRQVRDLQGTALEEAMIAGRRWRVPDFQHQFVYHPVMFQLARGLLWVGYTNQEQTPFLFRLNEKGDWIDERDHPLSAKPFATVGLVHPLHLSDEQRQTWGEVFANDELTSPFPQLGRPVASLLPGEDQGDQLRRWDHLSFPALTLLKILGRLGWSHGGLDDYIDPDRHFRAFPEADVTAIVRYSPGIPWEPFQGKELQRQLHCYFVRGCPDGGRLPQSDLALCLGRVDRVIASEVLCQLNMLALKGE